MPEPYVFDSSRWLAAMKFGTCRALMMSEYVAKFGHNWLASGRDMPFRPYVQRDMRDSCVTTQST
jgi:hypothetical protein